MKSKQYFITTRDFQIWIWFALRLSVFELYIGHFETSVVSHQKWPWTVRGQRYPICAVLLPLSYNSTCVALELTISKIVAIFIFKWATMLNVNPFKPCAALLGGVYHFAFLCLSMCVRLKNIEPISFVFSASVPSDEDKLINFESQSPVIPSCKTSS